MSESIETRLFDVEGALHRIGPTGDLEVHNGSEWRRCNGEVFAIVQTGRDLTPELAAEWYPDVDVDAPAAERELDGTTIERAEPAAQ